MNKFLFLLILITSSGCNKMDIINEEPYRPSFHFTPPSSWMNDPNGLVFHKGIYHLFYQYYPDSTIWGPMHWGHATSRDLINWKHQPIALYPDSLGYIFSGSAIADLENSSNLGTDSTSPLLAFFTYHLPELEKAGRTDYQYQGMAYSLDDGKNWIKYSHNPILPNDLKIKDFRDPKVFWHEASKQWILILVAGDHAKFYGSQNLVDWSYLSEFGRESGAHGGVWECPDLFPLRVQGKEEVRWVLLISTNPGAPNGGSGTQYFVGDFDGITFTPIQNDILWVDYGTDNYAGITYNHAPNDKRIFIGWMSNWLYGQVTPTKSYRSAMTLPRELFLIRSNGKYLLGSKPLPVLTTLRESSKYVHLSENEKVEINDEKINQSEIYFKIDPKISYDWNFINSLGEKVDFHFDAETQEIVVDRSNSGIIDFDPSFPKADIRLPLHFINESISHLEIQLFVDRSSIELFVNQGLAALTIQVFPRSPYNSFNINSLSKEGIISLFEQYPLQSAQIVLSNDDL